jgi:hypothetical protein
MRLLAAVDVLGDGSCWAYAALASHGLLEHAWRQDVDESWQRAPPARDRALDQMLRNAAHDWLSDWCPESAPAGHMHRIRTRLPRYSLGVLEAYGENGGALEFGAIADLFDCVIISANANASDHQRVRIHLPGAAGRACLGRRGASMAEALRVALDMRRPLVVLLNHNHHWRAHLPLHQAGHMLDATAAALHASS